MARGVERGKGILSVFDTAANVSHLRVTLLRAV